MSEVKACAICHSCMVMRDLKFCLDPQSGRGRVEFESVCERFKPLRDSRRGDGQSGRAAARPRERAV